MSSRYIHTEGVIIKSTEFQDRDHITTIFTRDSGILKLFLKKKNFTPLNQVEIVYSERKNEICSCHEISLLQSHAALRNQFHHLEAACDLLNALNISQLAGKPATPIYELLLFNLNKIHLEQDPSFFSSSFRLKILKYEGLLYFPLDVEEGRYFNADEQRVLETLSFSRSYREIASFSISKEFNARVHAFFIRSLRK